MCLLARVSGRQHKTVVTVCNHERHHEAPPYRQLDPRRRFRQYNFAVPSQLKAWIDRILVAGKTFRYTASGAEGLVHGKRVILAVSRGGVYEGTPAAAFEHQESWLKTALGFIGVTDVEVIRAEGIAHGPEQRETALKAALATAAGLAA